MRFCELVLFVQRGVVLLLLVSWVGGFRGPGKRLDRLSKLRYLSTLLTTLCNYSYLSGFEACE